MEESGQRLTRTDSYHAAYRRDYTMPVEASNRTTSPLAAESRGVVDAQKAYTHNGIQPYSKEI